MKKIIIVLAIGLLTGAMDAHADSIAAMPRAPRAPQAVATAFTTRFPNARDTKWMERDQGYIAGFRLNHQKVFAYYSSNGTWKATETPVKWSWDLPSAVRTGWLNSDYAAWYIVKISKIVTPTNTLYSMDVNDSPLLDADHAYGFTHEYVLLFSANGDLIRKTPK